MSKSMIHKIDKRHQVWNKLECKVKQEVWTHVKTQVSIEVSIEVDTGVEYLLNLYFLNLRGQK